MNTQENKTQIDFGINPADFSQDWMGVCLSHIMNISQSLKNPDVNVLEVQVKFAITMLPDKKHCDKIRVAWAKNLSERLATEQAKMGSLSTNDRIGIKTDCAIEALNDVISYLDLGAGLSLDHTVALARTLGAGNNE